MPDNKCVVLGGSFNPPTVAHIQLMRHAMKHTGAAFGVFVPSSHNYVYHKMAKQPLGSGCLFSEQARAGMLQAMIQHDSALDVSPVEFGDDGRGHTYATMRRLQASDPSKQFCFLLGADKLGILPKWHNIERFLDEFYFIVTSRSNHNAEKMIDANPILHAHAGKFLLIPELSGMENVSSTKARRLLQSGKCSSAAKILTPEVLEACVHELKN